MKKTVFLAVVLLLLQGCGGGGGSTPIDTTDTTAPEFTSSESISVAENQTRAITLQADDESSVTYSISGADADSFSVDSSSGVVTFKTAPNYEEKDSYSFTAKATDSANNSATQDVTIYITDIVEPFITVWETNSTDTNITIPTYSNYTYTYTIDWGDGTIEEGVAGDAIHTYSSEGNWTIKISGEFPHFCITSYMFATSNEKINAKKLRKVISFGDIKWKSMRDMFSYCDNMSFETTEAPILTNVTDMSRMFLRTYHSNFNKSIMSHWNTSNVKDMSYMFTASYTFNQDISNWNTSSVTDMKGMFSDAYAFNQDISNWNTSSVTDMKTMFMNADAFNQDISNWDTSNVTNMHDMFEYANAFNQDISKWDTSNVTDMGLMFYKATAFNQDLSNWDTSSVTDMGWMFYKATSFKDQDLSSWNVANVTRHDGFSTGSGGNIIEPNWP